MRMVQPSLVDGEARVTPMIAVGADNGREAAREAIEAVGGRQVACLDWQDAAPALGHYAGCSVLVIEAEGVSEAVLAEALPRLDAAAAALGIPVVISLDEASIDVVAATMASSQVQMLCRPTTSERVVALAIAAEQRGGVLADMVREGEAARLQRLNDEVARIAEILARLTRRGPDERASSAVVADHPTPFRQEHEPDLVIDAAEVRRAIRARRLRDQHFGAGLFEDPAWDILLDLFAADLEGAQVSVSSLCIAASVAPTTALRWIAKLTDSGLLERHPDPFDRRRAYMELSPDAGRAMRSHVAALRRAGLPFS